MPIKAVVFLREAVDEIRLEPVKRGEALPDLWTLTFRFHGDAERGRARAFSQVAKLAGCVSVWNLYRPMRLDNLKDVVERLVDLAR